MPTPATIARPVMSAPSIAPPPMWPAWQRVDKSISLNIDLMSRNSINVFGGGRAMPLTIRNRAGLMGGASALLFLFVTAAAAEEAAKTEQTTVDEIIVTSQK